MKFASLMFFAFLGSLCLVSCKSSFKGYTPAYLIPDTALDAPGVGASRKMERDKRRKDGLYEVGEVRPVRGGKAMLFMSNPDYDQHIKPVGELIEATTAKVIFCEGLYYFVETDNKDRGYMRESDLAAKAAETPSEQVMSTEGIISVPTDYSISDFSTLPGADSGGLFPEGGALINGGDSSTATTESGRVVNIKSRDTGKSEDFERMRDKIGQGADKQPESSPSPSDNQSSIPDLPMPTSKL